MHAMPYAGYTAFMYIEADMLVSWESLLAWAADNALLEPLGFQRGFYRVEVDPRNGLLGMCDQIKPFNITEWPETLTLPASPESGTLEARPSHGACFAMHRWPPPQAAADQATCAFTQERHFVRLPAPYCAVWIASRARLHSFSLSPQWAMKDSPWEARPCATTCQS